MAKDWSKHSAQHFQGRETMAKYDVDKWARDNGASPRQARLLAASDPNHKPSGHDKELADHERAHSGQPGAKVKHGADATGQYLRTSRPASTLHYDSPGARAAREDGKK